MNRTDSPRHKAGDTGAPGTPGASWSEKTLFHGGRFLLLFAVASLVAVLFPTAPRMSVERYDVGMVTEEDITAQIPFEVPKPPEVLEAERVAAANAVPPTFEFEDEATDLMASTLDGFFSGLQEAASVGPGAIEGELERAGLPATLRQVELLSDPGVRTALRRAALRATREIHPEGVVDAAQAGNLLTQRFTVRTASGEEYSMPSEDVMSTREFFDRAEELMGADASPEVEELLRLILIRFTEPNYVLDAAETYRDRDQARQSVPVTGSTVLAGEVILRRGERVQEDDLATLQAYETALQGQGLLESTGILGRLPFVGSVLLNFLLLGIFGLVLRFYRPEVYQNFRWLLVHAILVMLYFVVAEQLEGLPAAPELLPITFVSLTIAVLWDSRQALMLITILAALTALQPPLQDPRVLALTLMGGAAAAFSVRAMRRRAQTWAVIAVIALAYAVTLAALALIAQQPAVELLVSLGLAAMNVTVSAILAMGFLPVWEWYTRITTDQSLLEWADPNRPLLRRVSLEAPGTYAHSVNVANIAEAAANAIGANGLLCRVGAYYHDVGKVLKPQFFIENQPGGRNPHDKLKPATSATIVREHVTEGLRLARDAKVPVMIEPFIMEHHGTQLIGFFYQKAVEESEGGEVPDRAAFSYPGPTPQSRETAIVMIADSAESATKVLQDPSPERIRGLVESLVESKLEAGQFTEAPLTFSELEVVKDTVAKVLSGMYHHRIDYPQTKHLTDASGGARSPAGPESGGGGESSGGKGEGTPARSGPSGNAPV